MKQEEHVIARQKAEIKGLKEHNSRLNKKVIAAVDKYMHISRTAESHMRGAAAVIDQQQEKITTLRMVIQQLIKHSGKFTDQEQAELLDPKIKSDANICHLMEDLKIQKG